MKKYILLLSLIALSGCSLTDKFSSTKTSEDPVVAQVQTVETKTGLPISVGAQNFTVEVATTSSERELGLMGRTELLGDQGMLFIFEASKIHSFWMKDTLIPLDILWISADMKVVDMVTAQPCVSEECDIYTPSNAAQYVLEVNATSFTGEIGDTVSFDQ